MFTRETVAHRQYLRQTKFMNMSRPLYEVDPQVAIAIDNEVRRQHEGLELIASENFVSEAVLEAMGSVSAPGNFSLRSTLTFNLMPARKPTWQPTLPSCSRATRFWA